MKDNEWLLRVQSGEDIEPMSYKDPEANRAAARAGMRKWRAAHPELCKKRWRQHSEAYRRRLKLAQRRAAGSADPGASTGAGNVYAD